MPDGPDPQGEGAAIARVLVVGSGVMGRGIAAGFAAGGLETAILSRRPELLGTLPDGVRAVADARALDADLVVESVPEDLALKCEVFGRLEETCRDDCILASNTSALPLPELAAALRLPNRFLGLHYFQPAETMELVEVIRVAETGDTAVARVEAALERCGREAIVLARPVIGALINRLQHAMLHEAYHLLDEGVVTPAEIDRIAKRLLAPRMCVTGLLEQKDISGLDTNVLSQRAIVPHLCHRDRPHRFVEDLVARNDLGIKTGRGFYDWSQRDPEAEKRRAAEKLARILDLVRDEG